jgi:uncharacterized alpha-E superfamily protein
LLDLFDSGITFRARWQRHEDLLALVDLLVMDDTNPRAFAGALRRLRTELSKLPGLDAWREEMRALLPTQGAGLALDDLREWPLMALPARLVALSMQLSDGVGRLSDVIAQRYFAHSGADAMQRV